VRTDDITVIVVDLQGFWASGGGGKANGASASAPKKGKGGDAGSRRGSLATK